MFAKRVRRYPLEAEFEVASAEDPDERDTRYPRVGPEEVIQAAPEMIILPSEPFTFEDAHRGELLDLLGSTPAVQNGMVIDVDGRLLGWHGTMLAHALAELPAIIGDG